MVDLGIKQTLENMNWILGEIEDKAKKDMTIYKTIKNALLKELGYPENTNSKYNRFKGDQFICAIAPNYESSSQPAFILRVSNNLEIKNSSIDDLYSICREFNTYNIVNISSEEFSINSINEVDGVIELSTYNKYSTSNIEDEVVLSLSSKQFRWDNLNIGEPDIRRYGNKQVVNTEEVSTLDYEKEKSYINRITELQNKNAELMEEIEKLKAEISELKHEHLTSSESMQKTSKDLLDSITDSKDIPKTYVGVINVQLFRQKDLHKFVGSALQELYEIVSFDMQKYLFNGDIFKLCKAERCDMVLGERKYDLDLSRMTEDEVLNALNNLFYKFRDRVSFVYKIIGNADIEKDNKLEVDSTIINKVLGYEDTIEEKLDSEIDSYNKLNVLDEDVKLLGVKLSELEKLKGSDIIKNVRAIGINTVVSGKRETSVYKIGYNTQEIDSIKALMNLAGITNVRQARKPLTTKIKEDNNILGVTILKNDSVDKLELGDLLDMILEVADNLKIDKDDAFVYFEADYVTKLKNSYIEYGKLNLDVKQEDLYIDDYKYTLHSFIDSSKVYELEKATNNFKQAFNNVVQHIVAVQDGSVGKVTACDNISALHELITLYIDRIAKNLDRNTDVIEYINSKFDDFVPFKFIEEVKEKDLEDIEQLCETSRKDFLYNKKLYEFNTKTSYNELSILIGLSTEWGDFKSHVLAFRVEMNVDTYEKCINKYGTADVDSNFDMLFLLDILNEKKLKR